MDQAGMGEKELAEALEHDEARRAEKNIPSETIASLEKRQALLAKAAAMAYTGVARNCAELILEELSQPKGIKNMHGFLSIGEHALRLAREADVLGDRAEARVPSK